jgi:general secretion pathway protein H
MQGFTLIEILIVVFIIGLTASVISLSMGDAKKDSAPYQEASTLLQAIAFVSEYSALNGEVIAMFVSQKESENALNKQWCYRWKRFRDNNWGEMPEDTLTEHCLSDTVVWELVIEGRIYAYDPDLEVQPPVLVFSPSGEATPVEMALFESAASASASSSDNAQHIEIDMMGNSRWLEQDEAEAGNEK